MKAIIFAISGAIAGASGSLYAFHEGFVWTNMLGVVMSTQVVLYVLFDLHPGPLPEYRGSFARTHAILNGEKSFGVTVHYLSERVDRGDIIGELQFPVLSSETALSLDTRAQLYGYALFCEVWLRLLDGSVSCRSQDELIAQEKRKACFYPMRKMTAFWIRQTFHAAPKNSIGSTALFTFHHALSLQSGLSNES